MVEGLPDFGADGDFDLFPLFAGALPGGLEELARLAAEGVVVVDGFGGDVEDGPPVAVGCCEEPAGEVVGVLRATAASYVVSPAAVTASAADPDASEDHLSAGYLVALAGRLVREVGTLARRAGASGRRLPTLTIDTQIGFRSAADRAAFADDLSAAVIDLAARYHHDDGRPYRLVVATHPVPEEETP